MEREEMNDLREIHRIRRGDVYIIRERCKGCRYCIEFCPQGVLFESEEFNARGHHPPILKEELPSKVCIGCGFCTLICPEFAIFCKIRGGENEESSKCTGRNTFFKRQ